MPQADDVDAHDSIDSSAGILSAIQKVSDPCVWATSLIIQTTSFVKLSKLSAQVPSIVKHG
jgi:hypothetical protein